MLFCGPESFTPDVHPMLGPAPELDGYFVAAGLNWLGILLAGGVGNVVAQWIVDGVPPVDITGYAVDRALPHETSRRFRAERTVEQLGVLSGDAVWPSWKPTRPRATSAARSCTTGWSLQGGHFNVSMGWEFAEWYDIDAVHPESTARLRPAGRLRHHRRGAPDGPEGRRHARHEPDGQAHGAGT